MTPKGVYMRRREFLGALVAVTGLGDNSPATNGPLLDRYSEVTSSRWV